MIIKVLDSLDLTNDELQRILAPLKAQGHDIQVDVPVPSIQKQCAQYSETDILIIGNKPLPDEVIEAASSLKMISVAFTGIDHVGPTHLKNHDITVTNAAGYSDTSVAELVIALTMNLLRNIHSADSSVRTGGTMKGLIGYELRNKVVGIVGTGRIGLKTASLFKAFGCKLIAYNPSVKKEGLALGIDYCSLEDVMASSDIVTLHVPLIKATEGLISRDLLWRMKKTSLLINCARGPIVDNEALAVALNEGRIAGAGIDVYDMEPPIPDDYSLLHAKNILLTPHVAYATKESLIRRAEIAVENVSKYIAGSPQNVVI